jgi:flagellar protein FlbB
LELLEEKEKALAEQEKSFNERLKQYENRRANLRQSAEYFAGMPPQHAVDRLLEMEDQDIIDILRTSERLAQESGEGSLVAYWLSLMPSERAAQLSRKMLKKPEG